MSATSSIDSQIRNYLGILNEQQKRALLLVAKTFADESKTKEAIYSDEFVTKLDRRTHSLEEGSVKGISWEEVKRKARHAVKIKNK